MGVNIERRMLLKLIAVARSTSINWRKSGRINNPGNTKRKGTTLHLKQLLVPINSNDKAILVCVYRDGVKVLSRIFWPKDRDYRTVKDFYEEARKTLASG